VVKKGPKKPRKLVKSERFPLIEKEIHKRTKAELVAIILAIAKEHAIVARECEDRLTIEKPVDLLVADVLSAIDRATDFDERMMNHNFDVDWQAYADVEKGLSLLVELGHLADAKSVALKLMKDGSYQVECSDEGLMTDEISQCLKPVIRAVKAAGGDEAVKWLATYKLPTVLGVFVTRNWQS
jgi:hypothetical protein